MSEFVNLPSQRFYEFFNEKLQSKKITIDEFAESFGKKRQSAYTYLNQLKRGRVGVTVSMILIAEREYKLKPKSLFV